MAVRLECLETIANQRNKRLAVISILQHKKSPTESVMQCICRQRQQYLMLEQMITQFACEHFQRSDWSRCYPPRWWAGSECPCFFAFDSDDETDRKHDQFRESLREVGDISLFHYGPDDALVDLEKVRLSREQQGDSDN